MGALSSRLLRAKRREATKDRSQSPGPAAPESPLPELTSRSGAFYSPKPTASARGRGTLGFVALRPLRLPSDPRARKRSPPSACVHTAFRMVPAFWKGWGVSTFATGVLREDGARRRTGRGWMGRIREEVQAGPEGSALESYARGRPRLQGRLLLRLPSCPHHLGPSNARRAPPRCPSPRSTGSSCTSLKFLLPWIGLRERVPVNPVLSAAQGKASAMGSSPPPTPGPSFRAIRASSRASNPSGGS